MDMSSGGNCPDRSPGRVEQPGRRSGTDIRSRRKRCRKSTGKFPNISVIGEMDAIGCKAHPMADAQNGTAHACGHHAQMAVLAGAAMAFADPEIRKQITGSLTFLAVPAEEYIDADKKNSPSETGNLFRFRQK